MRCLLVVASAAALRPSNAPLPLVEKSRRAFGAAAVASAFVALPANAKIDVNNAMAREFSAYPGAARRPFARPRRWRPRSETSAPHAGLFPTVGTKLVKRGPFKSKRDMYAALDTDVERAALRKYDAAIVLNARDSAVMQYKGSQICKYECGRGKGGGYRDEQIRQVQTNRR